MLDEKRAKYANLYMQNNVSISSIWVPYMGVMTLCLANQKLVDHGLGSITQKKKVLLHSFFSFFCTPFYISFFFLLFNSIQLFYSCNKSFWPEVQIQIQVLTVSAIHGVQMLLIYI